MSTPSLTAGFESLQTRVQEPAFQEAAASSRQQAGILRLANDGCRQIISYLDYDSLQEARTVCKIFCLEIIEMLHIQHAKAATGDVQAQYVNARIYLSSQQGSIQKIGMILMRLSAMGALQQEGIKDLALYHKLSDFFINLEGHSPQNRQIAFHLASEGARQGYAWGQTNLGVCYEKGIGVEVDEEVAARLYGLAAAQGDARAQARLENLIT